MTDRRYAAAGVDLAEADRAKRRIQEAVASTRTALVAGRPGAFGGMVRLPAEVEHPVLVMSTDGVGTKVLVAREAGRLDTVGEDLVNHSVNDILVHGARPLAFLDYIAGAGLSEDEIAALVEGVARGCRNHGMALAGGETAAMPGLYQVGHFDLAGTIVGVVAEERAIHGDRIAAGDICVGLASSGLHTNGYTLARRILFEDMGLGMGDRFPESDGTVADVLLTVHRSYEAALRPVLDRIHGLAHITGGGIAGNLVRILPEGVTAVIDPAAWEWPSLFRVLQVGGGVSVDEMREVFNLGIGMVAVVPEAVGESFLQWIAKTGVGIEGWRIGRIEVGNQEVHYTSS